MREEIRGTGNIGSGQRMSVGINHSELKIRIQIHKSLLDCLIELTLMGSPAGCLHPAEMFSFTAGSWSLPIIFLILKPRTKNKGSSVAVHSNPTSIVLTLKVQSVAVIQDQTQLWIG